MSVLTELPAAAAQHRLTTIAALLLGFSAAGCEETGTSDTIRVFAWPDHPIPSEESFDVVAETFGMEVLIADDWHRAITIYPTEYVEDTGLTGLATGPTCSPHIGISPRVTQLVLTHEIGHTLGLQHVDAPGNLMNIDDMDFDLTDRQLRTAAETAWKIESCRN